MGKKLTLKNHLAEIRLFNRRVLIALFLIVSFTGILITRLIYLQIIQHDEYTTLSEQNRLDVIPIEPNRGLIYDRNGALLAENRPSFSLEIIPGQVPNLQKTLQRLQKIIPIRNTELKAFFKQVKQCRHYESVPIKSNLDEKISARFQVHEYQFPGISIKTRMIRHYLHANTLSSVIGYVGRINTQELKTIDSSNYSATNYIGKTGLEYQYENELHGHVGYQEVEINAAGRVVRTLHRIPPHSGTDLYLNIDVELQKTAQKALGKETGAVVAIDPRNGQLLTFLSTPTYNPNRFVRGLSQREYSQLLNAPNHPLYNRVTRGQYPLASTIKPFIALGALMNHVIDPKQRIYDPGWFQLKNSSHVYRDWKRRGHGWINMARAIVVSCDTYFYVLANQLGIQRLADTLKRFAFGEKTGIDLPNERMGLVPTPAWKRVHKGEGWYPGDTVISAIGQGFTLTTPLQLAVATAMLGSQGAHYVPSLIHAMRRFNENSSMRPPQRLETLKLPTWEWGIIIEAMKQVITSPHGTGHRFGQPKHYTVAAKTGTAQVISLAQHPNRRNEELPKHLRDHSLFIAFASLHHPKIAVAIIVEHSDNAPRVARALMEAYFNRSPAESPHVF